MRVKISDILKATGGKLLCGDEAVAVTSFFTDSRQAKAGAMFVPIRGERADGHDYIPAVLESPAAATFTDHEIPLGEKPIVLVKDCREALQKAAAWYREQFAIPVVGVTGSVGKTTAKEMVAQALTAKFRVLKTAGNQNSQVGVPITVCGLKKDHTAAVVEMGVSMPGEMARIAAVVKPTCAVMTNIGVSHIEFMKTRENILKEKAHIADYIPVDGALFVNGDDDLLPTLKETLGGKVVTFGLGPTCDWRAYGLNEADKGTFFTCLSPTGEKTEVFVPAAGEHNVRNALAAVAVAVEVGVPEEKAAAANVDTHAVEKANRDSLFKYHIAKVEEDEFEDEVTLTHEDFVLGIRPECVSICEDGALEGEIFSAMPTGMETTVKVRVGEFLFTGVVFGGITYKIGQKVRLSFTGADILMFSRENGKLITRGTMKI